MIGQDEQMRRFPGLPSVGRGLLAFVVGLALGALGILLFGQSDWPGPVLLLLPLALGVLGRLLAGSPQQGQEARGMVMADLALFGLWLTVLGWDSFHPQTSIECSFPDGPCLPTTVSFWGEDSFINMLGFGFLLIAGLMLILVGVFVTSIVLDTVQRSVNRPD